jgi:hypothetical protein
MSVVNGKKWPVRLTAKQAPHRPDTAPAHGLHAEMAAFDDTADRTVLTREGLVMHRITRTTRFQLESLESRRLLSTLTVSSVADSGTGSLRARIAAAQSGDTINFAPTLGGQTITLTSGVLSIAKSLTIQGLGANQLTIHGASGYRIFNISGSTSQVAIRDLTITGVAGFTGGAIFNTAALTVSGCTLAGHSSVYYYPGGWGSGPGAAIYNSGTLIVSNSTLSGNRAEDGPGGLGGAGGAIYNSGTLTVSGSILSGNSAGYGYGAGGGGAIYNDSGTATISGSILSGNTAQDGGGAISTHGGAVTVSNCTIANNHATGRTYGIYDEEGNLIALAGTDAGGGGISAGAGALSIDHSTLAGNDAFGGFGDAGYEGVGRGGALYGVATRLYDTIIAGNRAREGPDLNVGVITSLGHNLIGNSSGGSGFVASDLLNVDPQLGPLQNNGGFTQTMDLLSGSPAINAGDNANAPAFDQRGASFPRIVGGTIDIGAFESATPIGKTWIGPASGGNWSTAANWSPSGVPSTTDSVFISGSKTVNVSTDITVGGLSVGGGAKLDLSDKQLTVNYSGASPIGSWNGSTYTGITGLIQSGRNGGAWNGSGIVTSSANGNLTSLGVGETGGDAVVRLTYAGDANLDGKINVDDYGKIDFNVNLSTSGWFNGDFNYDGKINVDDYGIIDSNVTIQGPPLSSAAPALDVEIKARALATLPSSSTTMSSSEPTHRDRDVFDSIFSTAGIDFQPSASQ